MLQTFFETKLALPFPTAPISPDLFVRQYGRTGVVTTQALWGAASIDIQVPIPIYASDGTVSYRVEIRPVSEIYVKRVAARMLRDYKAKLKWLKQCLTPVFLGPCF
jgi:hypothetical protein